MVCDCPVRPGQNKSDRFSESRCTTRLAQLFTSLTHECVRDIGKVRLVPPACQQSSVAFLVLSNIATTLGGLQLLTPVNCW